jgi:hypothetical protein
MIDGDPPGREAQAEIVSRLAGRFHVRAVNLPEGVQPDTIPEEELGDSSQRCRRTSNTRCGSARGVFFCDPLPSRRACRCDSSYVLMPATSSPGGQSARLQADDQGARYWPGVDRCRRLGSEQVSKSLLDRANPRSITPSCRAPLIAKTVSGGRSGLRTFASRPSPRSMGHGRSAASCSPHPVK